MFLIIKAFFIINLESYNIDTDYLEIFLGFSCIELERQITFGEKQHKVIPIESLIIYYIISMIEVDKNLRLIDMVDIYRNQEQLRDNILLMKKYSCPPSFQNILSILTDILSYNNYEFIKEEVVQILNILDLTNFKKCIIFFIIYNKWQVKNLKKLQ